jgi:hypothetical protein
MRIAWLVALFAALTGQAAAQMWVDPATISPTTTLTPNRLCYSDGRDLACDSAAGLITGNGAVQWTSISATNISASAITVNGVAVGGGGDGLGDRIVSGSLLTVANSDTGIISLTTGATTWGYLSSGASYIPSLTSTVISATAVQVASDTTVCGSGTAGRLSYVSGSLLLCNGSSWSNVGVGVPAGTIAAFASSTCPSGWTEYTAARGRFLRGIDNGAGNDPDGTRSPGGTQADAFQGHRHNMNSGNYSIYAMSNNTPAMGASRAGGDTYGQVLDAITDGTNGTPRTASETRPKNVAVTFCEYSGIGSEGGGGGSGSGGLPDNLGNHTATQDLDMASHNIVNGAAATFSGVVSATNISATMLQLNGAGSCSTGNIGAMRRNPSTGKLQVCLDH